MFLSIYTTEEAEMNKIMLLGFLMAIGSINVFGKTEVSLIDKYLAKQSPKELRLYFMVKSQLKTRSERLFFLNLARKDKITYTKYLLGGSEVSFSTSRSSFSLF